MDVLKQKFDQAELNVHDEEDGECQLEIVMVLTNTHTTCSATIWLDSDQRKDLIKMLQDMEHGAMNKVSEVSAQVKRNETEYNRIWNAAIEECCNYLKSKADHSTIVSMLRKLKK